MRSAACRCRRRLVSQSFRGEPVGVRLGLGVAGERGQPEQELDLLRRERGPAVVQLEVRDREMDVRVARRDRQELQADVERRVQAAGGAMDERRR